MCAGGIPFQTDNHAYKIILAAFEIIDFVEQSKNIVVENRINFKVRIGVNSGSIVAGIVGTKSLPMISGEQLT
jgi:class 3 adenylate cyclase